jgi:hypothetical protein
MPQCCRPPGFARVVGIALLGLNGMSTVLALTPPQVKGGKKPAVPPDVLFQEFGKILASLGDLNGDKRPEFLIGCKRDIVIEGVTVGGTRVYSGADGSILFDFPAADAVAVGPDLNKDGVADFALGYPSVTKVGSVRGGSIEVRSGKDGSLLGSARGSLSNEHLGASLAFSGDLLAAGGPGASPGGLTNAGMVRIFDARTMTLRHSIAGTQKNIQFGIRLAGPGPDPGGNRVGAFFAGWTVDEERHRYAIGVTAILATDGSMGRSWGAGDWASFAVGVDHDGRGTVLIAGYPFGSCESESRESRVFVCAMKTREELCAKKTQENLRAEATRSSGVQGDDDANFGDSVASAGDWDGDGIEEILVGGRNARPGGKSLAGQVLVLSGRNCGGVMVLDGGEEEEQLGVRVSSAGDLDLDGVPEVLAGAPDAALDKYFGCGRVRVFSGKTGALLWRLDAASGTASYAKSKKAAGAPSDPEKPPPGK